MEKLSFCRKLTNLRAETKRLSRKKDDRWKTKKDGLMQLRATNLSKRKAQDISEEDL